MDHQIRGVAGWDDDGDEDTLRLAERVHPGELSKELIHTCQSSIDVKDCDAHVVYVMTFLGIDESTNSIMCTRELSVVDPS